MDYNYLPLDSSLLTFQQIRNYVEDNQNISITQKAQTAITDCRRYLDQKLGDSDNLYYGINTGFGFLQNVSIDKGQLHRLQDNLLQSHSCGIGDEVPEEIVRLILMLKVKSLSYGHSGVSIDIVNRLVDMHNAGIFPVVYTKGSLGASGDLAPLAHLSLPLIGLGEVNFEHNKMSSGEALQRLGWQPLELQSKEGLALINGTQFMSSYGMFCLVKAGKMLEWADLIAAISLEAYQCNTNFLNKRIHEVRPHEGQIKTAERIRSLINGSKIAARQKKNLQDPYSFRCMPQVHGASKDTFNFVLHTFLTEINSVTDNPNIFPEDDLIISGGNFHGQPLALGLDFLAIAMSEIANISERRTYQLLSGQRNLPLFLVKDGGLNSGLMIPQYTAASLVSENKQLCTPASVDSISSSNNQEDHVSMGANAAVKCWRVMRNVSEVLAIELMTACQALDFTRAEDSSPAIKKVFSDYRTVVPFASADHIYHNDIVATVNFIEHYDIEKKLLL